MSRDECPRCKCEMIVRDFCAVCGWREGQEISAGAEPRRGNNLYEIDSQSWNDGKIQAERETYKGAVLIDFANWSIRVWGTNEKPFNKFGDTTEPSIQVLMADALLSLSTAIGKPRQYFPECTGQSSDLVFAKGQKIKMYRTKDGRWLFSTTTWGSSLPLVEIENREWADPNFRKLVLETEMKETENGQERMP